MKPIDNIYFAFFKSKKKELYFNELKELSTLSDSSLNKNLKELIENKEVSKNKQKSNTFYTLINKDIKASYFAKFAILKFNSLNYKVKIPLIEFLDKINNIKYIIHFGSSSRGEEKRGSDIDLLIVLHKFENKELNNLYQKEIKSRIDEIKNNVQINSIYPLSCFYITEDSFISNLDDNLVISAKNTGYPIYNQIEYYKK